MKRDVDYAQSKKLLKRRGLLVPALESPVIRRVKSEAQRREQERQVSLKASKRRSEAKIDDLIIKSCLEVTRLDNEVTRLKAVWYEAWQVLCKLIYKEDSQLTEEEKENG